VSGFEGTWPKVAWDIESLGPRDEAGVWGDGFTLTFV
jgi:hypothetical protein